jgi:hypothetical protein
MSNLLQKASIITTPTAYDTGKILSVKPVQYYGPEIVINGDFATDSDWTINGGNAEISNGKLNFNNAAAYGTSVSNSASVVSGKTYLVEFTISDYSSGSAQIRLGSQFGTSRNANGTYTEYIVSNDILIRIYPPSNNTTLSIDNVSIKEVLNADFDFTRNSSATRVGSNGLIQTVASNLPRIDYTGGVGSWKFEPQRINLINYSESISNTPVKSGTYTDNFAISPDGTLNATKVTATSVDPYFYQYISYSAASYTASIYIKGIGNSVGKEFQIRLGSNIYTDVIPLEWTRFKYTVTMASGVTLSGFEAPNPAIVGDEVLVWGWQIEEGSYPTSYIRSNIGSATTRLADVANNAGSSNLINSTEGVLYAEFSTISSDAVNSRYIGISNGSVDNRIAIRQLGGSTNQVGCFVVVGGSVQANLISTINLVNFNKIAVKYKANDFALWVNGIELATDTSGTVPSEGTFNKLDFANFNGSSLPFEGNTKSVAVFKEALTDLELECLVSWMSFSDLGINFGYTVE